MNNRMPYRTLSVAWCLGLISATFCLAVGAATPSDPAPAAVVTVPGMPPVVDPMNLYSEAVAGRFSPTVAGDLPRVYVPNRRSNDVYVIDPATFTVVNRFKVGFNPQHVVPSWDLRTLWVTNNADGLVDGRDGSLTPIDPETGKPARVTPLEDPYNMYFTPDGAFAIVVAEALMCSTQQPAK